MILYIENSKDSTQKLLGLINKFSNIARYKINMQKSVPLLYTDNEISESVQFSHVCLFATGWTTARLASLSITNSEFTQTHVH